MAASSLHDVRQQRHEAGALDRVGEQALLLGRYRGDARGHDLAALGNEALQQLHVFVIDLRRVGAAERAGLLAPEERPALSAGTAVASTALAAFAATAIAATVSAAISTVTHRTAPSTIGFSVPSGLRSSRS